MVDTSKYPQVTVVVPKMENPNDPPKTVTAAQPPANAANTSTTMPANPPPNSANSGTATTAKPETSSPEPAIEVPREISDAEMQLVSSLAKLQQMESMIHQLRTLLPDRILDPLVPIVNPEAAGGRAPPKSPQMLYQQLAQAMSSGVAEVSAFQGLWRSAEMRTMWERIDGQIRENGGVMLQPTGVWDRDYEALLRELAGREKALVERQRGAEEERERARIRASERGWRSVVDGFLGRGGGGAALRVVPRKDQAEMMAVLVKAGMRFRVCADGDGDAAPEWRVLPCAVPGQGVTRVEGAVAECLNLRGRRWDLEHLFDMMSAYGDIKQTPCAKCGKMTDSAANLPTIRQQRPAQADGQPAGWEALHTSCA